MVTAKVEKRFNMNGRVYLPGDTVAFGTLDRAKSAEAYGYVSEVSEAQAPSPVTKPVEAPVKKGKPAKKGRR